MGRDGSLPMKARIENGFRWWGHFVYRNRWAVLVASLAVSAALMSLAPGLRVDNSSKSMLRPGDPARQQYDAFLEEFGQDHLVVILVQTPSLFRMDFLERLRALHRDLEESVPYVNEVTSLRNARLTRGEGDELIVEDLLEEWPAAPADLALFERRVRESPYYRDLLVDRDFEVTALLLEPLVYSQQGVEDQALAGFDEPDGADDEAAPLLTPAETSELVSAVLAVVERHRRDDFAIHVAGSTAANNRTAALVMQDIKVFMSGTAVMVALVLLVLFRRLSGVVLPLLVVFASLFATFGIMALLDIPTSIAGQVLAPLLICVGVCDAVHLLALIYERESLGDGREQALAFALGHSGLAVLMTSLTTAGGLLSFVSAELAQIVNLGIAAPLGIALAFVLTMTLLPSLVAILPMRARREPGRDPLDRWLSGRLQGVGDWSTRHAGGVIAAAALLAVLAVVGMAGLRFSQDTVRWLPEQEPLRIATELIDAKIRGSTSLEVLVDTGRDGGLHDPNVLAAIDTASRAIEAYEGGEVAPGKVFSIVDILKETHRALNENRPEFYRVPDDRELIAQEFLLFENSGSEDLADFVDMRYRVARVMVRTPSADYMHFPDFIEDVRGQFSHDLGDRAEIRMTGSAALYARTFSVVNSSMARSYVIALVVIAPLMMLLIGNVRLGLLAMIPNLLPVLLTLGLMGWLDIRIDNSTLMVGCIVFGLAVDDTIHFMHGYQRAYRDLGDVREAVGRTLATTGVALLMTTLVIAIGFFVLTFAYMLNTREFGILACFATIAALVADVMLMPAILMAAARRQPAATSR